MDKPIKCDGWCKQTGNVAMLDRKGYAYCVPCGHTRRENGIPCRKLRPWELRRLQKGLPLKKY